MGIEYWEGTNDDDGDDDKIASDRPWDGYLNERKGEWKQEKERI